MGLMLVCSFDPFYIGPCPPGCLVPLNESCGCNPSSGCCSMCPR